MGKVGDATGARRLIAFYMAARGCRAAAIPWRRKQTRLSINCPCSHALHGNTLPGCSASAITAVRLLVIKRSHFQFQPSLSPVFNCNKSNNCNTATVLHLISDDLCNRKLLYSNHFRPDESSQVA